MALGGLRPEGEANSGSRAGRNPAIAVPVALVVAFAALGAAARGAGPLPGDLAVTRLLQGLPADGLTGLVLLYAGDAAWFLPVVAVGGALLARRWAGALCLLLVAVGAVLLGDALKALVGRPRPSADPVARLDVPEGFGFPSATALLVVAVLGVACYLLLRYRVPRPVAFAAIAVSVLASAAIGLSRVYAGEHWASDVLGGWLSGGALALVAVVASRSWRPGGRREGDARARAAR
ncbi:phosphatase PAP2 family protein [Rubrobacter marinus]|uniref:phosphatase PAP2 family protein n=1 Tax=Rubrobacter marinus TaxID=2653852 RepID=UPI00140B2293|nr:phosphatase PAP2 family protein [Rubrobacter marinus]